AAVPVEQAALLGALIRAHAVLYGVGRGPVVFRAPDLIVDHGVSLPAAVGAPNKPPEPLDHRAGREVSSMTR
ncbi:MAG: hypothetical protein ACRDT8_24300, partial [Micromonosporaceae bacterium]